MAADLWVHADSVDDPLCIETFGLCVCVELIEVSDTYCQICISEKLDSFGLCRVRDKSLDVLRLLSGSLFLGASSLKKQIRKHLSFFLLMVVCSDNNAAWVQVFIESLGFAEELRAEDDIVDVRISACVHQYI